MIAIALLGGCSGSDAGLGDTCDRTSDCDSALQCMRGVCVHRCQRSPDCGDGYACDSDGACHLAEGREGDLCKSEVECGPGLSCVISNGALDDDGRLRATCTASYTTGPANSACFADPDCRNGTCALGQCVDLCLQTRDCAGGNSCMVVPRVEADGSPFGGCLPSGGNITWRIPNTTPAPTILLPVPSEASYASLVFEVDDQQVVGATRVVSPAGKTLVETCYKADVPGGPQRLCEPGSLDAKTEFFGNDVRRTFSTGMSVLAMPSNPAIDLETGVYHVNAGSFRQDRLPSASIPKITAVVRIGTGGALDLHLHFLDLGEHPCRAAFKNGALDAETAASEDFFQVGFLPALRSIFTTKGIAIGAVTYDDITDHPDLDGLRVGDAPALLKLGKYDKGINIFFVRSMSPVGLQGFAPAPGPAGLGKTAGSGIVIGVDTLCYRSWSELARLTAHEIARYMGLYHNVEVDNIHGDPIPDSSASPENLMFYSELTNGTDLSFGQRDILLRSPVLR